MRQHDYRVAGDPVTINVVERPEDLDRFRDFVRANLRRLAVDTETTGLDIYSRDTLRLVQFGNEHEAWVLPVELDEVFAEDARKTLRAVGELEIHNAGFDLSVADRMLWVPMEELWPRTTDTQTLAKLIDPRPTERGGPGAGLEDLTRHYIDADVADQVKKLMTKLAKEHKTTKAKIWSVIDLFHPEYNLYAGMDAILTARLSRIQKRLLPGSAQGLVGFERRVSEVCALMSRTGFLLDVEYSEELSQRLLDDQERWSDIAAEYGVDNVNSTDQVAEGLLRTGVKLRERTETGKYKVDKKVLGPLIQQGNTLAVAVFEAKKAGKWRSTWVDTFLNTRDEFDRCHPWINTLQARTGRMSITGIPAQTLPSGDWMIRRCFLSEPGHRIASVDYMAQELRVLAALSGDRTMIQAFKDGADLHLLTARAAFGEHITKDSPERKYAKVVNFGRVYGGGANTVAEQTGLDLATAKRVVDGFDKAYPGVTAYSRKLARFAGQNGYITTPIGRRLPVDPARSYSALNYMVQSTSRDVTCRGLLKLHQAGFTPYLRLPVHDEVVASLPDAKAEWGAQEIARLMAEDIGPVWIGTEPEVGLRSWGSLYKADY